MMMNNTISKIVVCLLLVVLMIFPVTLHAQDFKERIKSMQKEYETMTSVHIVMDINVKENKNAAEAYYSETAIVKKSDNNYFSRISSMEMLMNNTYLITVNEQVGQITCTKRDLKGEKELADPFATNLDSLLSFYGTPQLMGNVNNVEHYTLSQKDGPILTIELYIDVVTNTLKRIDYLYEDGQYVIIDFKLFDRKPAFGKDEFLESKYFTEQKGKLILADKYSRFRLSIN